LVQDFKKGVLYFKIRNQQQVRRVTLQFADGRDLRRFVQIVSCTYLEIDLKALTLSCDCDDKEVELAQNAFSAKLLTDANAVSRIAE
jgi:hypothetical protein